MEEIDSELVFLSMPRADPRYIQAWVEQWWTRKHGVIKQMAYSCSGRRFYRRSHSWWHISGHPICHASSPKRTSPHRHHVQNDHSCSRSQSCYTAVCVHCSTSKGRLGWSHSARSITPSDFPGLACPTERWWSFVRQYPGLRASQRPCHCRLSRHPGRFR